MNLNLENDDIASAELLQSEKRVIVKLHHEGISPEKISTMVKKHIDVVQRVIDEDETSNAGSDTLVAGLSRKLANLYSRRND